MNQYVGGMLYCVGCTVDPIQGHFSPGIRLMIISDSGNSLMIGGLVLLKYTGNGDKFRK